MDEHFRVEVIEKTPNPQRVIWISGHQCVCEGVAIDDPCPPEDKAGEYIVKHLLAGNRGHFSPLEAPQINFNIAGFNHRAMQQITRHRIGVHFSVQSFRYTGERYSELGQRFDGSYFDATRPNTWDDELLAEVESLFYLRPIGEYKDRDTGLYSYTEAERNIDLSRCAVTSVWYHLGRQQNKSHEQCAGLLPMDARQNWVMSANVRSLMHLMDLRWKADAQLECQQLCDLIWSHFESWVPSVAAWYKENRAKKARLAP